MQYENLPLRPLSDTLAEAIRTEHRHHRRPFPRRRRIAGSLWSGDRTLLLLRLPPDRCDFTRTTLVDVRFEHCDLSGVRFDDAGLHRVQFLDCRITGAHFNSTLWDEVQAQSSVFDYANLIRSEWRTMPLAEQFPGYRALRADSQEKLRRCCDFTRADFTHAHISGLDLSQAVIEGTLFALDGLKDVKVSRDQAGALARLLALSLFKEDLPCRRPIQAASTSL